MIIGVESKRLNFSRVYQVVIIILSIMCVLLLFSLERVGVKNREQDEIITSLETELRVVKDTVERHEAELKSEQAKEE